MPIARLSLVLAVCPAAAPAGAQDWPQHTVRLITPLEPGSGIDIAARTFTERLAQR